MPGVVVWRPAGEVGDVRSRFARARQLLVRTGQDEVVTDVDAPWLQVAHGGYPGYPVRSWADGQVTIVFEGHVYGQPEGQVRDRLTAMAHAAFAGPSATSPIAEFVRDTDGEFVVVLVASSDRRLIVFGDALGRLPLDLHRGPAGLVISREAKAAAAIAGSWAFDPIGVAESLWLGYPLADRTLFRGIARAPEGFLLESASADDPPTISTTYAYRIDPPPIAASTAAVAADIADRIIRATAARAEVAGDAPVVVALSGGNDSRSVIPGLRGRASIAATFDRGGGRGASDIAVARQLAAAFEIPWHRIEVPAPSADDEERLVWLRDGLNHVGMAFILAYLETVAGRWSDRAVLLTGDGGDKVLPDPRPTARLRTMDDLVRAVVSDAALMPAADVEAALGLPSGALEAGLRDRLSTYPEARLDARFARFQIAERGRRWLFDGEDRGRCFLWQTTPFYAIPVFEAALAVPFDRKQDLRLYAAVQRALDPRLVSIPHADVGLAIDDPAYRARSRARRILLRDLGPIVRPVLRRLRRGHVTSTVAGRADAEARIAALGSASPLRAAGLDPIAARASIARAGSAAIDSWRTLLILEQVWGSRLGAGTVSPPRGPDPA